MTNPCASCGLRSCEGECYFAEPEKVCVCCGDEFQELDDCGLCDGCSEQIVDVVADRDPKTGNHRIAA